MPPAGEHVWGWFWELDKGRSIGFDMNRLSWSDIESWSRITGVRLKPWELNAIHEMDSYRVNPDYDRNPVPQKVLTLTEQLKQLKDAHLKGKKPKNGRSR